MPFKEKDPNINRGGRPRGRKNKVNPDKEIEKAFSSGMSLSEILDFISEKIRGTKDGSVKLSENELIKYIAKILDIKMALAKEYMQIIKDSKPLEPKKEQPKEQEKSQGSVVKFNTKASG